MLAADADEKVIVDVRGESTQILNNTRQVARELGFDAIKMFAISIAVAIYGLFMPLFGWEQYALISLFAVGDALFYGGILSFETWRVTNHMLDSHSKIVDDNEEKLFRSEGLFHALGG